MGGGYYGGGVWANGGIRAWGSGCFGLEGLGWGVDAERGGGTGSGVAGEGPTADWQLWGGRRPKPDVRGRVSTGIVPSRTVNVLSNDWQTPRFPRCCRMRPIHHCWPPPIRSTEVLRLKSNIYSPSGLLIASLTTESAKTKIDRSFGSCHFDPLKCTDDSKRRKTGAPAAGTPASLSLSRSDGPYCS